MGTTTRTNYLDAIMNAGFAPVDSHGFPDWCATGRHAVDGILRRTDGRLLTANYTDDTLTLAVVTESGVVYQELRFAAPDEDLGLLAFEAFAAVVTVWS